MSCFQSAIVPEAGPFALYVQFKITSEPQRVVDALKKVPALVDELNQKQPEADLTAAIAFSHEFFQKSKMRFSTATGELEGLNETTVTLHKSKNWRWIFSIFQFWKGYRNVL